MSQLHKRFTSDQVKELLERYLKNEVDFSFMPFWSRRRPVGPIFWPYRPSSFTMDFLTPIMSILTRSFDLSGEETLSGKNTIF